MSEYSNVGLSEFDDAHVEIAAEIFSMLADPTRIRLILALREDELSGEPSRGDGRPVAGGGVSTPGEAADGADGDHPDRRAIACSTGGERPRTQARARRHLPSRAHGRRRGATPPQCGARRMSTGHDHAAGRARARSESQAPRNRVFDHGDDPCRAEVVGAILTNSLALLVDCGTHAHRRRRLATALIAANLARRPATAKRTWGFARAESAVCDRAGCVCCWRWVWFVLIEGVQRLFAPPEIASAGLLTFGSDRPGRQHRVDPGPGSGRNANFNLRAAFLEVVNDALGSVAVIVPPRSSSRSPDGVAADAICGVADWRSDPSAAFKLLRETVSVLLETTPSGLDLDAVRQHLLERDRVVDVHDLHASQIATGLPVLTAHVIVDPRLLHRRFTAALLG